MAPLKLNVIRLLT